MPWGIGALGLAAVVGFVACGAWAASAQSTEGPRVVAEVGPDVITSDVLDRALGPRRYRSEGQRYEFQRQKLDELINDKLLEQEAARRNISVAQLKATEVKAHVRVTPQEVDAFYRARKDSIPASESAAKETLKRYLEHQRELEVTRRFLERLRAKTKVQVKLARPAPPPDYLAVPDAPVKGPQNAPITIVAFSDFRCSACASADTVVKQLLETYPNDIKLVFRHFPLVDHPQARLAAEAAECAARQGKFWEYHDELFTDATEVSETRLRTLADAIGLDRQAFSTCLETGAARARVRRDLDHGVRVGVTATPTFFINERRVEGARSLAAFKEIIDTQLTLRRPQGAARLR